MKIARIYERVSTSEQDLTRQAAIEKMAIDNDYYSIVLVDPFTMPGTSVITYRH